MTTYTDIGIYTLEFIYSSQQILTIKKASYLGNHSQGSISVRAILKMDMRSGGLHNRMGFAYFITSTKRRYTIQTLISPERNPFLNFHLQNIST